MTDQKFNTAAPDGPTRRSLLQSAAAVLTFPMIATSAKSAGQDKLAGSGEVVVFSYGGSYAAAVREHIFDPFTNATGIKVVEVTADVAGPQSKAMFKAGRVDWDLVILYGTEHSELGGDGMLLPIDYTLWDQESLEGVPARARGKDRVVLYRSSIVLTYGERSFPNGGPTSWVDFWDIKKFPGPRGLRQTYTSLYSALLADGVAHADMFPLTDEKVDRAFKKLNELKPHIPKWWSANPDNLLIQGEYAVSSTFDGATIRAIRKGAPLKFVWDVAASNANYNAILKGGPNTLNAQKLIAYQNRAEVTARYTSALGYVGQNRNQLKYLTADAAEMLRGLQSAEAASKVVYVDDDWMNARRPDGKMNSEHIEERWLAWLTQ
ncbi:hypothetical protein CVM73_35220 [Bradyrhizobium forestalis]|uniref:ABC transporter substrate-binding protein n=1 Tax=Bradyrhizobium forestalis TaxID=1419263 RepID=A0A2M8QYK0_9BRAD|nr:ABC transporter substrate-binding protein [Bradyrhizobium forestalis]PJG50644.1 hypothetical protein CVM73_35220 [Bradyrhizobium forestalis]